MFRGSIITITAILACAAPLRAHAESGATGVLMGAAAIAGAGAQIGAAAAAAGADVAVNQINAEAMKYITDSNNRLNLQLQGISSTTQLIMAGMQAKVALAANDQVTKRQAATLAAVDRSNDLNNRFYLRSMEMDYSLRYQALALQAKAMDYTFRNNLRLATQGVSTQQHAGDSIALTSSGLVTGPSQSASTRLLSNVGQPVGNAFRSARGLVPVGRSVASLIASRALAPVVDKRDWPRHAPSAPRATATPRAASQGASTHARDL